MSLLNLAKNVQTAEAKPLPLDAETLIALSASLEDLANTYQPNDSEGHLWQTQRFVERLVVPIRTISLTYLMTSEYHFSKNVKPGQPIPQRRRSDPNRVVPTAPLDNFEFMNDSPHVTEGVFEFAL